MKFIELTDVATNAFTAVNLDEVFAMEPVRGRAGATLTRLTFHCGHKVIVYETISVIRQLARVRRQPLCVAREH